MTLSRVTNGDAFGPSGKSINLKTLSWMRLLTCCGWQERHSAISVARSTGSLGNFNAEYRADTMRISCWKLRALPRCFTVFQPGLVFAGTMISSGKIKCAIWRNSGPFSREVRGNEQSPAYSKRLCRKILISRRAAWRERMSNVQRNSPPSINASNSPMVTFTNIAAARIGTSGWRPVKPNVNLMGIGMAGLAGSRRGQMMLDLGGSNGTRNIFMGDKSLEWWEFKRAWKLKCGCGVHRSLRGSAPDIYYLHFAVQPPCCGNFYRKVTYESSKKSKITTNIIRTSEIKPSETGINTAKTGRCDRFFAERRRELGKQPEHALAGKTGPTRQKTGRHH